MNKYIDPQTYIPSTFYLLGVLHDGEIHSALRAGPGGSGGRENPGRSLLVYCEGKPNKMKERQRKQNWEFVLVEFGEPDFTFAGSYEQHQGGHRHRGVGNAHAP